MCFFNVLPKSPLLNSLIAYKSASSRLVKKNYPEIRQYLWKEAFWTKSYCLISTGGVSIDVIKQYIERQGQK